LFKTKLKKSSDVYKSGLNKIDCNWTRNHKKTKARKVVWKRNLYLAISSWSSSD